MTHEKKTLLHVLKEFLACESFDRPSQFRQATFFVSRVEPIHSERLTKISPVGVLIEHVDAATQLINLCTADDPRSDAFAQHLIFVFPPEHIKFLAEVDLGWELTLEIGLLVRDQLEVLAEEGAQEFVGSYRIFFEDACDAVQVALKKVLAILEVFVEDGGA